MRARSSGTGTETETGTGTGVGVQAGRDFSSLDLNGWLWLACYCLSFLCFGWVGTRCQVPGARCQVSVSLSPLG